MSETMQTIQYAAPGDARLITVPLPVPKEGEALVKVLGVTTCPQWDFHLMSGEPMFEGKPLPYPYRIGQPGHEAMGEVIAVGRSVAGLKPGARVVAWRDPGHNRQGAYAQYNTWLAENLIEIPSGMAPQAIASLELAMCVHVAFDQIMRWTTIEGKLFAVGGLGPAGIVAVQMARAYGAREVVGIDPLPARRELAQRVGADRCLAPDAPQMPKDNKAKNAFALAVECAGAAASLQTLMGATSEAIAIFSVLRGEVSYGHRHTRGLSILGYVKHNRPAADRALRLILDGKLDLLPLVSCSFPLSRYTEGIEILKRREALKVCYLPWEE